MDTPIEFLGETRAYANVRPRRLGYLVRQGDYRHLDRAVAYATSEWGGWSQPILPVRRRRVIEPRWLQFAEILRPEVFIDYVGVDEELKDALGRDLGGKVIPPPTAGGAEPGVHATVVHGRDSLRGRTIFVPRQSDGYAEKLALGVLPSDWSAPWEATGATIHEWETLEEFITAQLGTRPSLMSLTRAYTGAYETSG